MNAFAIAGGMILIAVGVAVRISGQGSPTPARTIDHTAPNLAEVGDLVETEARARRLLAALRNADWNEHAVPADLWRVPDQDRSQIVEQRAPDVPTFRTGGHLYGAPVAFFSSLYEHRTRVPVSRVAEGVRSRYEVTGFHLVMFRDGTFKRVPVAQIRGAEVPGQKSIWLATYPGMPNYRPTGRRYPGTYDPNAASVPPATQ
ncbi:MAG: hypothetical protein SFX74_10305 [Fimbriimonadaceae bacterium]|nr:hypothetical protein [Fimbriimonadaceae bacterium]